MTLRIPFYPKHKLWNSILNSQAHDDGQEWSSILYYQYNCLHEFWMFKNCYSNARLLNKISFHYSIFFPNNCLLLVVASMVCLRESPSKGWGIPKTRGLGMTW
jgi:hypothetical protein